MAASRRTAQQAPATPAWASPTLLVVGVLLGAVVVYFGYPGMALTWLLVTLAAWAAPVAQFTGKKDASGYPTPASPGEAAAMQRFRFWADLKWRLMFPAEALAPGWPVYASWLGGLWAAAVLWCLPHTDVALLGDLPRHVDAAFAFVLVTQVAAARRRTAVAGDVSPGVRVDAAKHIRGADREVLVPVVAATLLGAALGSYLLGAYLPAPPVPVIGSVTWFVLGALGGAGAGIAKWWVEASLTPWRIVCAAREEWAPRWQMLKHDPAPFLTARDTVGSATVDTFTAPGSMGAVAYWPLAPKVTPTLGAGQRIAIISTPNTDSQGQPVPGTRHPLQFQVVAWPADAIPDVTALDADPDEVNLLLQVAMIWAADDGGFARPILNEAVPLALVAPADDNDDTSGKAPTGATTSQRQAWGTTWLLPDGPPMSYVRSALRDPYAGHLGSEVLVDHRNSFVYVGGLTDDSTVFDPNTGVSPDALRALAVEDTWNGRWAAVLKQDVNPPTIEHSTYSEANLANGLTVHRQAFLTRQGVDPMDFFGLEAKIAATMDAAQYVAVTGWGSTRRGDKTARPGERHPQAFTVYWSQDRVPANPDTLAPSGARDEAAQWVLAGHLNAAFKAARLAQPEMYDAKCLTHQRSRGHIWKMPLRLYGGVTLADVRGAAQRLRQNLASEWLRVEAAPDGCTIIAGVSPSKASLANPTRDERYLASLDWEQAFLDAKVVGVGGITPTLTAVDRLPNNQQVQVLDFTLPSGLAFIDVKASSKALETSSKNAFVEARRAPSGKADSFRLLASEVNPMPERAEFDFVAAETGSHKIPFATNLFGEPTAYDNAVDAHLLISGVSGGGKSQRLTALFPVPVSDRFPTGWATNGDLVEGDLVYAADGSTTPVTAFSPIVTEPVYRLTLSDGQVVEAGGHHLWKVSTQRARSLGRGALASRRAARLADYTGRAADIRALASESGPTQVATLTDIARLLDMHETAIYQLNLPLTHLAVAMQVPTKKRSRVYDVEAVADYFDTQIAKRDGAYRFANWTLLPPHVTGLRVAGAKMDGWLTMRAITDALIGHESTRAERSATRQVLTRGSFTSQDGLTTMTVPVYPVDEVLHLIADHLDHWAARADSGHEVQPLETILNTEEILAAGPDKGFAIRRATPLQGDPIDAPVEPYTLGVWLGDGTTGSGTITRGATEVCTDVDGYTDQQHLIDQMGLHYPCYPMPSCPETTLSTRGLRTALRHADVLHAKHIPATYLRASYEQRLALLQGLMDTDGSVNVDGQCELDLCDERLARDAQELLRTLGIYTTLRREPAQITEADPDNPGKKRQRQTSWRFRQKFTTDLVVFRLPRKVARLKETGNLRSTQDWLYIESIEKVEPAPMRCIAVAHPEHLYLTDGFVPTHNSVALQNFIYGALIRNWDLYVVDPSKGAVDFNFAEPYSRAVGRTVWEAKGIIAAIYAEVLRRKAVNSQYNCGNYRDLPEEVRYNHVLIVLDEFTSMMLPEPVPKAMDDSAETLHAIESAKAINAARAFIGSYVGKIVREARSTGFTMLLATQALKADTLAKIPGANDLKDNMSRMIVGRASYGQLAAALKMPTEVPAQADVLPAGRGLYEGNGRASEIVQCWFEPSQSVFSERLATRIIPVPAERKVDVSSFVEPDLEVDGSRIDEAEMILPVAPMEAMPQVVDLGEIELSLDDLELTLSDLEAEDAAEAGDAPQSDPADETVVGAQTGFDWDAAEAAAAAAPEADDDDDLDWSSASEPTVAVADEVAQAEDAVAVESTVVWDEIDPSPWEPSLSQYGWPEIEAVLGFLDTYPHVREVTWTDAHLLDEDDMGVAFRDVVEDLLTERGVALLGPTTAPVEDRVPVAVSVASPALDEDDEFGPLPTVPAHLIPDDNPFA